MSYKQYFCLYIIIFISYSVTPQEAINSNSSIAKKPFNAYTSLDGFFSPNSVSLPFWFRTNVNGTIATETNIRFRTGVSKTFQFGDNNNLVVGGGLNVADGFEKKIQVEELYVNYKKKWFNIIAGVKHNEIKYNGLSTINGSILWTTNARSIPGIQLKTSNPIPLNNWLNFKASLAHYELNDKRFVEGAKIHHKSLHLGFKLTEKSNLSLGLEHFVQWGGVSPVFGRQPERIKDFINLFLGKSGGNTRNDQINALGNHLGSYKIEYKLKSDKLSYTWYYQTLFEDRSGRELNNFPDGVWGMVIQPTNDKIINTLVLEYIQTVSQSGRPRSVDGENQQSGGDNYFSNSIYGSGWTYQGNIIGLPFIIRNPLNSFTVSNRTSGFQLGASGSYKNFDYQMKSTFITNLGTYQVGYDPKERAIYTYGNVAYNSKFGVFNLQLGADFSSLFDTTFGAGIGYQYNLN